MLPLLLASSSPYRRELLARLQLDFDWAAPDIDETALPGETATELATRLAVGKARALSSAYPGHLIIGSDQVALCREQCLGKPSGPEQARLQLQQASGHSVTFLTGLALLDARSGALQTACIPFRVRFRTLEPEEIDRYLAREQPYDCAGSFRAEGLGISLFEAMEGEDYTSLIGLPLIELGRMLRQAGRAIP